MRFPRFGVLLVAAVALAGCSACSHSSSSGPGARVPADGCASALHERLDPRSTVHLFPGASEPAYLTDPPTSGPHRLGPPFVGVVSAPIARPSQVAMLESGYVIVQAQGLPADQSTALAGLAGLAGRLVTVAPPVAALPSPVVATAWTWKLECGSATPPAMAAIRAFIAAHQGVGFFGNKPPPSSPATTAAPGP